MHRAAQHDFCRVRLAGRVQQQRQIVQTGCGELVLAPEHHHVPSKSFPGLELCLFCLPALLQRRSLVCNASCDNRRGCADIAVNVRRAWSSADNSELRLAACCELAPCKSSCTRSALLISMIASSCDGVGFVSSSPAIAWRSARSSRPLQARKRHSLLYMEQTGAHLKAS